MTMILALSNTNLNDGNLPRKIVKLAEAADLVLHAGNFTSQTAYDALNKACNGKLWAVYGDSDPKDNNTSLLMDSDNKPLGKKIIDDWNGIRIYLANNPCEPLNFSEDLAMKEAEDNIADLLVFGNINQPLIMWGKKDVESAKSQMLVCPGNSSITSIYKSSFPSVALVHIIKNEFSSKGEIFSVELVRIASLKFQDKWRWCQKCQGLFFSPNVRQSKCPAGGEHDGSRGGHYLLACNDPNAAGQDKWRWCQKCQGLFFAPNVGEKSKCPAGEEHDRSGSGNYTVIHKDSTAPGQSNWQRCKKCQGLFFGGGNNGVCPSGGTKKEPHAKIDSGNYSVEFD
jgi:predicted phosphodiesterase